MTELLKNEKLESWSRKALDFNAQLETLKQQTHASMIDHIKRNYFMSKTLKKRGLLTLQAFALGVNNLAGNLFRNFEFNIDDSEPQYYSLKKLDGQVIKIEFEKDKKITLTLIKQENIFTTTLKIKNILGFKKIKYQVHVFGKEPISIFSLNTFMRKVFLKKDFKQTFNSLDIGYKNKKEEVKNINSNELYLYRLDQFKNEK
ncbi:hypothetical protein SSABA_v1c04040 [Spiroplasma sabaudiense Ar-1343]|uniref:Uncharacterized protein n=1 Tax=Spiroplasma sabaudiense Ar-1343 TaxID=1276257 RepID=W6A9J8_9MOLU|nr:hypothetical protein [Spiroplasma sabaudiense]AHI53813.1 hypothetical protein SSABA_v1c04040 [Spiroplasma sabaudiense Ar-1343]